MQIHRPSRKDRSDHYIPTSLGLALAKHSMDGVWGAKSTTDLPYVQCDETLLNEIPVVFQVAQFFFQQYTMSRVFHSGLEKPGKNNLSK